MKRSDLIKKMLTPMWVLHIVIDAGLITAYYVYVHPPSTVSSIQSMAVELIVILGVADIITHYALKYD
jgi:hypothetical protein